MPDDAPVAQMLEIAASGVPLLERARALVECLDQWLPVDAIWLTLCDPTSQVYATVGTTGPEPIKVIELPVPVEELPTWADCLIPAGFSDGLGVPLREPGGFYVGMLSLLFADRDPPSASLRRRIARVAPLIARGVSPIRPLLDTARIVDGAAWGAVLLRDGGSCPLPGHLAHPLLGPDSRVVTAAREMLLSGHVYRSFLWPETGADGSTTHARITVLSAGDVPAFFLGTVLITPHADCGLTARELEVLGLIVDGRSNSEISRRLFVSCRTVATHVEHILHKLQVPTRTLAAVRADREGWYLPSVQTTESGSSF